MMSLVRHAALSRSKAAPIHELMYFCFQSYLRPLVVNNNTTVDRIAPKLNFYTFCERSHNLALPLFLPSPDPESDHHLDISSEDLDTTDFHSETDAAPFPEVSARFFLIRLTL